MEPQNKSLNKPKSTWAKRNTSNNKNHRRRKVSFFRIHQIRSKGLPKIVRFITFKNISSSLWDRFLVWKLYPKKSELHTNLQQRFLIISKNRKKLPELFYNKFSAFSKPEIKIQRFNSSKISEREKCLQSLQTTQMKQLNQLKKFWGILQKSKWNNVK